MNELYCQRMLVLAKNVCTIDTFFRFTLPSSSGCFVYLRTVKHTAIPMKPRRQIAKSTARTVTPTSGSLWPKIIRGTK